MVDTHCHILPGLDDGAKTFEESVEMCLMACRDGVRTIVATPHGYDGADGNYRREITKQCATLNMLLAEQHIDIKVLPGMELRMVPEVVRLVSKPDAPTLNDNRYLLMEFHPTQYVAGFDVLVDKAAENGYGIIIAHPEKNLAIQSNPSFLYDLIRRFPPWTVLAQVTADSLNGMWGATVKSSAALLLKNHLVHLIASDAHNIADRPPLLSEAVASAARFVGDSSAHSMVCEIPNAVVGYDTFPEYMPPRNPRQRWRFF